MAAVKLLEIEVGGKGYNFSIPAVAMQAHLKCDKNRQNLADELLDLSKKCRQGKWPFLKA